VKRGLLAIAPTLAFLGLFFVVPVLGMLQRSLFTPAFSLTAYRDILHESTYWIVFASTFRIAAEVTLVSLGAGYPVAYWLSGLPPRRAHMYLVFVAVPYFTSVLVRTYAWMVLLSNDGLVNHVLATLHLIVHPLKLLYNETGVLAGMTYVLLPYMILALYAVMRGIDRRLVRAASVFGAGPWQAFLRVFLPLSVPGVAGGCLLVFVLALGFFITPALMGGPHQTMIAMLIDTEVDQLLNWSVASALAMVLLAITLVGLFLYDRLVGLETLLQGRC